MSKIERIKHPFALIDWGNNYSSQATLGVEKLEPFVLIAEGLLNEGEEVSAIYETLHDLLVVLDGEPEDVDYVLHKVGIYRLPVDSDNGDLWVGEGRLEFQDCTGCFHDVRVTEIEEDGPYHKPIWNVYMETEYDSTPIRSLGLDKDHVEYIKKVTNY